MISNVTQGVEKTLDRIPVVNIVKRMLDRYTPLKVKKKLLNLFFSVIQLFSGFTFQAFLYLTITSHFHYLLSFIFYDAPYQLYSIIVLILILLYFLVFNFIHNIIKFLKQEKNSTNCCLDFINKYFLNHTNHLKRCV